VATTAVAVVANSIEVLPADILRDTKAISRKRPFEEEDDSMRGEEDQGPRKKKARIDVHAALLVPELDNHRPSSSSKHPPQPDLISSSTTLLGESSAKPDGDDIVPPHRFSIFPKSSRNVSRAIRQRFLSQIRQTPANDGDDPNDTS